MERNKLLLFFIIFTLAGCAPAAPAPPDSPTAPASAPAETQAEAPTPTVTIEPTAAPPMECTIAFDSNRDSNLEIYRMAPDGSQLLNLSNHPADDVRPAWSPDGSRIAFVSNRQNEYGGGNHIHLMNADGSDVQPLPFPAECDDPSWSRWFRESCDGRDRRPQPGCGFWRLDSFF